MEQRLQKIMASAGIGSRRHCETLIATGRVAVDGVTVDQAGTKADPEQNSITVDGVLIKASQENVYLLLHKPVGYTSTRSDRHAQHTILELVKDVAEFVYPVGRLDVDTSGLLILTNDGELTNLLTHPSHEITKTYRAVVTGRVVNEELVQLEKGMLLDDGLTAPAQCQLVSYSASNDTSVVLITIHEGRNRQVRRMFGALGHRIQALSRIQVGGLTLEGLAPGKYRKLTSTEIEDLRNSASPQA